MAISHPPALESALAALAAGQNRDPFGVLGPHADERGRGFVVRAFHPAAPAIDLVLRRTGEVKPMVRREVPGVFEAVVPLDAAGPPRGDPSPLDLDYRLRITFAHDHVAEMDDPYRYGRVLTEFDLHLLAEGTHHRAFEKLGAHRITIGSTTGIHFAVWAPNADRVSVVGDFNGWDGRVHPMRLLEPTASGKSSSPSSPTARSTSSRSGRCRASC